MSGIKGNRKPKAISLQVITEDIDLEYVLVSSGEGRQEPLPLTSAPVRVCVKKTHF